VATEKKVKVDTVMSRQDSISRAEAGETARHCQQNMERLLGRIRTTPQPILWERPRLDHSPRRRR